MIRYLSRLCCAAFLACLALAGGLGAVAAAGDEASFSLQPVRNAANRSSAQNYFVYDATPGQQLRDEMVVRNNGTATGVVRLYAVDGATGNNSGAVYLNENDPRREVATWIRIADDELTLAPGESRVVGFTVAVPADAEAGQHLGAVVAANVTPKQGAKAGVIQIETQSRAVTAVQLTLPGATVEQITVTGLTVGGWQGQQTIDVGLRNDGNVLVKPTGTLVVTDAQGQELQRLPLHLDTFVPRTTIHYPILVQRQALGTGQYRASVELSYGQGGVTSYRGEFSVTPAEVARSFPPQGGPAQLAPPQVAPQQVAPAAQQGANESARWSLRSIWSTVAGVLIALSLGINAVFLWRRNVRRGA